MKAFIIHAELTVRLHDSGKEVKEEINHSSFDDSKLGAAYAADLYAAVQVVRGMVGQPWTVGLFTDNPQRGTIVAVEVLNSRTTEDK